MTYASNAFDIAKKELRDCYDKFGIVAGKHHYNDYWTRDAGFGILGSLVLGDLDIVKTHLTLLLAGQKASGFIPFLVMQQLPILNFFGKSVKTPKLIYRFKSHKALFISDVVDSNAYFVIAFSEYLKKSKDTNFGNTNWPKIEKSVGWYFRQLDKNDLLLSEGPIAGWNDGIYKTGKVLISNLLVYKTFVEFNEIASLLHKSNKFAGMPQKIKVSVNQKFFNDSYYIDWIGKKRFEYFDTIANLLSVLWDVADRKQARSIIDFVKKRLFKSDLIPCSYPKYSNDRIEIFNRLVGMGDYWGGDSVFWPEPILLYAMCLKKVGEQHSADKVFEKFSKMVVEQKGIYEVYDKTIKPLNKTIYKAEHPYARGSGLYIMCFNFLKESPASL